MHAHTIITAPVMKKGSKIPDNNEGSNEEESIICIQEVMQGNFQTTPTLNWSMLVTKWGDECCIGAAAAAQ